MLVVKSQQNLDSVLKSRDITLPTKVCIVKLWSYQWSHTVVRAGPERRQNAKELMPLNWGVGEDSSKSLGQQGDQTSQSERKSTLNIHWKDWWWSSSILVIRWEQMTHWKVPDAGKDRGQKEKRVSEDEMAGWHLRCNEHNLGQTLEDDEGQSALQSMGSQGVGHDWVTEQQQKSQQRQKMKEVIIGERKREKRLQGGLGSSWENVSTLDQRDPSCTGAGGKESKMSMKAARWGNWSWGDSLLMVTIVLKIGGFVFGSEGGDQGWSWRLEDCEETERVRAFPGRNCRHYWCPVFCFCFAITFFPSGLTQ